MLITLQSDAGGNPSDFTNYFKQTVQIEPNSELAFVSIGYSFDNDGSGDRETQVMLVNIDEFEIKSVCKDGGIQKAVAAVPYGALEQDATKAKGEFFYEAYNLQYQPLGNKHIENHNQMRVRITRANGNPVSFMDGITTVTLDVRPRMG